MKTQASPRLTNEMGEGSNSDDDAEKIEDAESFQGDSEQLDSDVAALCSLMERFVWCE